MDADERAALTAKYDRLTARIRHMDALNIPVPAELACEQEALRRRLDALLED